MESHLYAPEKKKGSAARCEAIELIEADHGSGSDHIDDIDHDTRIMIEMDDGAEDTAEEASPVSPVKTAALIGGLFSAASLLAYLARFRHAGANSATADWIDDLPEHERVIYQSIKQHSVPSTTFMPAPVQQSKGDILINSVRLLGVVHAALAPPSASSFALASPATPALSTAPDYVLAGHGDGASFIPSDLAYGGMVVGSRHAEMIGTDEMTAEIRLIQSVPMPHLHATRADPTTSARPLRQRRNVDAGAGVIEESAVKERIAAIFSDGDLFSVNMRAELSAVLEVVERSDDYVAAFAHEDIVFLRLVMALLSEIKNAHVHAVPQTMTLSYHYLDKAQRALWQIVKRLPDELQEQFFSDFIRQQQNVIWAQSDKEIAFSDCNSLFGEYTASQHPKWHKKKISSESQVVIHHADHFQVFRIWQLLEAEHASFIRDVPWVAHFDFDTSGYPDDELMAFVSQSGKGDGKSFMISPATRLLEANYQQMNASPLYFDKRENIPAVAPQVTSQESLQVLSDVDPNVLAAAVVTQVLQVPAYMPVDTSVLAFAHALVENSDKARLGDFDVTLLLKADYLYEYRDSYGRTRRDTALLAELLARNSALKEFPVAQREEVRILWPAQFSNELIVYFETLSQLIGNYIDKLQTSLRIAEKQQQLHKKIPDVAGELKTIIKKICRDAKMPHCAPDTKVRYSYSKEARWWQKTPESQNKEFTLFELLLGEKRRWEEDASLGSGTLQQYRNRPPNSQHKALLKKIEDFRTQEYLIGKLETLNEDTVFRKSFEEYIDLLESTRRYRSEPVVRFHFKDAPSLIIYHYRHLGKVELLSMMTAERFSFDSLNDMNRQIRQDLHLKERIELHFPRHLRGNLDMGQQQRSAMPLERRAMFEAFMAQKVSEVDRYIRSHGEAEFNTALNWTIQNAVVLAAPAIMMGPVSAAIYGAALLGGPLLLKAAATEDPEEQKRLIQEAILTIGLEVLSVGAFKFLGKTVSATVRTYSKVPSKLISSAKKTAGAAKNTLAKAQSYFSYNLGTVQTWFPGRIKHLLVDQAKPVALSKLQNARSVLTNPVYQEQVEIGARFYFGSAYPAAGFGKKIDEITAGFDRLTKASIDVKVTSKANSGNVAALDFGLFKLGEKTDKFLKVQKNGFDIYYKETGKSNAALADVLIHEISHGTSRTQDYVYIGSVSGSKGNVDVIELMKLGNKKLTVRQGKISSVFAGDDFDALLKTSFYEVGNPGAINADSIAQYISYLSKAETNTVQFTADYTKMRNALQKLDQPGDMSAVFLQRSKRAAQQDSELASHETTLMASKYMMVMDDANAATLYELAST